MDNIGRYKIEARISIGSIATSYVGVIPGSRRKYLIKVLHPYLLQDERLRERFLREARVLQELEHPGVVRVIEYGEENGKIFIVQEYLKGKNLREILDERGPLDFSEVRKIALELLNLLAYLHSRGVLHRDIKPSNVMVLEDGTVKLVDFGLAKPLNRTPITLDGEFVGTPEYTAPELFRGGEESPASDLFSLGATIYEILTGRRAFGGENISEVLRAVLETDPPRPSRLRKDVPPDLENLVMRLLRKDPKERPRDAFEALALLSPKRRRGVPLSVLYAALFLFFSLALVFYFRGNERQREARATVADTTEIQGIGEAESPESRDTLYLEAHTGSISRRSAQAIPSTKKALEGGAEEPADTAVEEEGEMAQASFISVNARPWAEVLLDSVRVGSVPPPITLDVSSGEHLLTFSNPFLMREDTHVVAAGGETLKVDVDLTSSMGYLLVSCRPWGELLVDDSMMGQLPLPAPLPLKEGTHRIEVRNPRYGRVFRRVKIAAGDTVRLAFDLHNKSGRIK